MRVPAKEGLCVRVGSALGPQAAVPGTGLLGLSPGEWPEGGSTGLLRSKAGPGSPGRTEEPEGADPETAPAPDRARASEAKAKVQQGTGRSGERAGLESGGEDRANARGQGKLVSGQPGARVGTDVGASSSPPWLFLGPHPMGRSDPGQPPSWPAQAAARVGCPNSPGRGSTELPVGLPPPLS